jgi:NADPH-dependent ferric siderophore reductase
MLIRTIMTVMSGRVRREPPRFRLVRVRRVAMVNSCLARVTLGGAELEGLTIDEPAASVRLLLPSPPSRELVVPTWNGNEFLVDGERPVIRTFTPLLSAEGTELDVEIVLHDEGVAAKWAAGTGFEDPAAVSGPGRGYAIDPDAGSYVLAGDESAIPAITQLLESLAPTSEVAVFVEARDGARRALPDHPRAVIEWCDSLLDALRDAEITGDTRVWAAGEAAAMQRIRRHLFEDRGVARRQATIRGYWKHGRAGDSETD